MAKRLLREYAEGDYIYGEYTEGPDYLIGYYDDDNVKHYYDIPIPILGIGTENPFANAATTPRKFYSDWNQNKYENYKSRVNNAKNNNGRSPDFATLLNEQNQIVLGDTNTQLHQHTHGVTRGAGNLLAKVLQQQQEAQRKRYNRGNGNAGIEMIYHAGMMLPPKNKKKKNVYMFSTIGTPLYSIPSNINLKNYKNSRNGTPLNSNPSNFTLKNYEIRGIGTPLFSKPSNINLKNYENGDIFISDYDKIYKLSDLNLSIYNVSEAQTLKNIISYFIKLKGYDPIEIVLDYNDPVPTMSYNPKEKYLCVYTRAVNAGKIDNSNNLFNILTHELDPKKGHLSENIPPDLYKYLDHARIYLNQIEAPNFANTSVSHKYSIIFGYVTRAWAAKDNYEIEFYQFEQMIDFFNKKFNGKYYISYSTMDNYKNLFVEIRIGSSHYQKEKIIIPPTPHD